MQLDGTMVTSKDIIIDQGIFDKFQSFLVNDEIIKPPANVFGSSSCSHAPPWIFDSLRVKLSESINPTIFQKFTETLSFLHGKSCCSFVSFWPCNINLLMADIQVSAQNGCFFLFKSLQILLKTFVPVFDSVVESVELLTSIWNVGCYQIKLFKLHGQNSSFMRMLWLRDILLHRKRQIFTKNCHTWIALRDFAEVPIARVSIKSDGSFFPSLLSNFCFIYTKNVRFWFIEVFLKIFFG